MRYIYLHMSVRCCSLGPSEQPVACHHICYLRTVLHTQPSPTYTQQLAAHRATSGAYHVRRKRREAVAISLDCIYLSIYLSSVV